MNIENLMSGIAVVIDDAFGENSSEGDPDRIVQLVNDIEKKWNKPFYKAPKMPSAEICSNLLKSASFILLDWQLWPDGAANLEADGIQDNLDFLKQAKDYFVPVFIFTNANPSDVSAALPDSLYNKDRPERNFIFIKQKEDLIEGVLFVSIEDWIQKSASVYTLKAWEQAFYEAKKSLFSSMYAKSPDWPKVFWESYKADSVDPGSSITRLINDNLLGRIKTDIFEQEILDSDTSSVSGGDIRSLIAETSFIEKNALPANEIRAGDLFKLPSGEYLINIRPDCDCVPRNSSHGIDNVELYCIEGKKMTKSEIGKSYSAGHFNERVWQSISFAVHEGENRSI